MVWLSQHIAHAFLQCGHETRSPSTVRLYFPDRFIPAPVVAGPTTQCTLVPIIHLGTSVNRNFEDARANNARANNARTISAVAPMRTA